MNISEILKQMISDYESINDIVMTEREKIILEHSFIFGMYTAFNHNKYISFPDWAKEKIIHIVTPHL